MIIDAHTHIGKKTVIACPEDLVKSMDKAEIDKSLVFAGKLNDQATHELLKDIAPFKGRLYGIGSVSPTSPTEPPGKSNVVGAVSTTRSRVLGYIERCFQDREIFGLKFYPGYEWFYPNDESVRDFLALCVKYDKPAIFHSGDCFNGACGAKLKYAHPLHIDDLAVDMPELKIIIAHMGHPWNRDAAEVCYKNKNVYADVSGFVYGKFSEADHSNFFKMLYEFKAIAGGTEKMIFGTDWPISNQKAYMKELKTFAFCSDMTKEERKEVMGLRAAKLFGIV